MPKLGYRKDAESRTYPVTFTLPGYLLDALDDEMARTGETSRSRLLAQIIKFWLENRPEKSPGADLIEADLDRFRNFVR